MSANKQDHPLRYIVDSHTTQGVQYVVELESYPNQEDCNGSCTCPHFSFRLEPHLRDGARPSDRLRCHHIKEARTKFLGTVIMQVLEAEAAANRKSLTRRRPKVKSQA
jgi:hypothetical protein